MIELELVVAAREPVAAGVIQLTLRHPVGDPLPGWEPGAHIDLVLRPDLVRQYSLCGDPADRSSWSVTVQREPDGRGGSRLAHDELTPGTVVRVRGPRNHFGLANAARYLFIAGGIGITPIKPMLAAADVAGADWRLLYGGRTRATMAFGGELQRRYGDRVQLCPQDEAGLLDLDSWLGTPAIDTLVYCCGPEPLLDAVQERCRTWPPEVLHLERFAPVAADSAGGSDNGFEIELALTGQTLAVPPDRSILQVVEEAGIPALSSCREGTCGTCETGVLDGVPEHRDSLLGGDADDVMLICVSRSRTPRLVLEL
ncbi:oxidoreductase [Natronosporangium hydrolyticum]|uniref:Oxidoreductase n=1 Tax=Natronosporangium hydrolyticum TaxID=2811111 RepID=A0A895YFT1_9ACTN|nr:PDR/VanB family oxidoreductase [Natronosporangium hydrolyticum]QSB16724.1 oxidoreductase [Natronosporangium hydrolyticum]